jgi:hypothetical protein
MKIRLPKSVRSIILIIAIYAGGLTAVFLAMQYLYLPPKVLVFCISFFVFYNAGQIIFVKCKYRNILARIAPPVFASLWIIFPSLIIKDITALLIAICGLLFIRNLDLSFKQIAIIAFTIIGYDLFMVFGTDLMMNFVGPLGINSTPLTITASPEVGKIIKIGTLGLGDIIFPGSLIIFCYLKGKQFAKKSLYVFPIIGYFLALVANIFVMNIFDHPQPATLYLYPGVFLGFWIALAKNNISLKSLFKDEK